MSGTAIPGLHPVPLEDARDALIETGFNPEAYRTHHRDVDANNLDAAGHFLEWGYAERRSFPITLNLTGLQRFRHLAFESRYYPQAVVAGLANAWSAELPRHGDRLIAAWDTITRLQALGAVPFFLVGDSSVRLYRHAQTRGGRFLLPIVLSDEIRHVSDFDDIMTPGRPAADVVATLATLAASRVTLPVPILWCLGTDTLQQWRDDTAGGLGASAPIGRFIDGAREFLRQAIPPTGRSNHILACNVPLPPRPGPRGNDLVGETEAVRALNAGLRREASLMGLRVIDDHDGFLDRSGTIAQRFLVDLPDGTSALDRARAADVFSGSLWAVLAAENRAVPELSERVRDILKAFRGE